MDNVAQPYSHSVRATGENNSSPHTSDKSSCCLSQSVLKRKPQIKIKNFGWGWDHDKWLTQAAVLTTEEELGGVVWEKGTWKLNVQLLWRPRFHGNGWVWSFPSFCTKGRSAVSLLSALEEPHLAFVLTSVASIHSLSFTRLAPSFSLLETRGWKGSTHTHSLSQHWGNVQVRRMPEVNVGQARAVLQKVLASGSAVN